MVQALYDAEYPFTLLSDTVGYFFLDHSSYTSEKVIFAALVSYGL